MPAAADSAEVLADELRVRLGLPDDEEQSEAEVRRWLVAALREVNADQPATKVGSFPTVAHQTNYDVVPAEAYAVQDVFYYPGGASGSDDPFRLLRLDDLFGYDYIAGGVAAGTRLFDNPALAVGFYKKVETYRHLFRGRMEREIDDGTIWLAPTPCGVCTVFFTYTAPRFPTLADVKKPWERWLLLRAEAFALEAMAHKRSHLVSSNLLGQAFSTGGGRVQLEMARQKLDQYHRGFRDRPVGTFVY